MPFFRVLSLDLSPFEARFCEHLGVTVIDEEVRRN
jgi:hypothetical protein